MLHSLMNQVLSPSGSEAIVSDASQDLAVRKIIEVEKWVISV